ncbi:MAG: YwaF family protein [Clostridia bacterium]|nr:YwaF family protein [Clostridia bacterium]
MYQLIVFALAGVICALSLLIFRGKSESKFRIFLKCLTVLFCAIGFFRFMFADSFIFVFNGIPVLGGGEFKNPDFLQSILRWGYFSIYAVLPIAVFYKNRLFRNVASYFCLPFAVASALFFDKFMKYFLDFQPYIDNSANGWHLNFGASFRYAFFVLELALAISIPIMLQIKEKHYFAVKNPKEWRNFGIALPLIILVTTPIYVPQSLFGYGLYKPTTFGGLHIGWMVLTVVAIIALYYVFRFRSYNDRFQLCMFLALVLFYQYNSYYLRGITIGRLPFQLCNIACFFYLIALVFNFKKMFQFAFLANIVGAIIAIISPNLTQGNFSLNTFHFMIEHSLVLMVPALAMGLRIIPRLTFKSLKYFFVGFTSYFSFSFVLGTILNGYKFNGETVNYFYMFDHEDILDRLPMFTFLTDTHYVFGKFEVYPFMILSIFIGFAALCLAFFFAVRYIYKFEDDHLDLRRSRIDLCEKITKKESKCPKNFID